MQRRKFIIGLGTLTAGGAAAIGTGAYSAAEMDRDANINVVNDADGLLALVPGEDAAGVVSLEDGELQIDFGGMDGDAGVNVNSRYQVGGLDYKHVHKTDPFGDTPDLESFVNGVPGSPYDNPGFSIINNDTVRHIVTIGYELTGSLNPNGTAMNLQARSEDLQGGTDITVRMGIDHDNPSDLMGFADGVGRITGDFPLNPGGYIGVSLLVDSTRSGAAPGEDVSGTLSVRAD